MTNFFRVGFILHKKNIEKWVKTLIYLLSVKKHNNIPKIGALGILFDATRRRMSKTFKKQLWSRLATAMILNKSFYVLNFRSNKHNFSTHKKFLLMFLRLETVI